jgi:sugar lactone lactonase YvrE
VLDALGNLVAAVATAGSVLYEFPASGGEPITVDLTINDEKLDDPDDLTTDANRNLYIAGGDGDGIVKIHPGGGTPVVTMLKVDVLIAYPNGIALSGSGDMFVSDGVTGRMVKIEALGRLTGSPSVIDNSLQAGPPGLSTQKIRLSGTGTAAFLTSPKP